MGSFRTPEGEKLERFLNQMEGELSTVVPYPVSRLQGIGATSKVKILLVVEEPGSAAVSHLDS